MCVPKQRFDTEGLTELVLALEFLDSTRSVNDLLRTCEERVTLVTDIDRKLRFVWSYFKLVTASTLYFTFHIFRVNTFSHCETFIVLFCDRQPTCSSPKQLRTLPYLSIGSLQQSLLRQLLGRYYIQIDLKIFESSAYLKNKGKEREVIRWSVEAKRQSLRGKNKEVYKLDKE